MKIGLYVLLLGLVLAFVLPNGQTSKVLVQYKNERLQPNCDLRPLTCTDQNVPPVQMERVMVIAAHPDDIEVAAGGTVARLVRTGVEVRYVLVTNGEHGSSNRSVTPGELAIIRQQEQLSASRQLGVTSVDFLGHEDGDVRNSLALQFNLTRLIRKYRPHAIFTWNPAQTGQLDLYLHGLQHADHRTTGLAVLDVVYPKIRDFMYFPELLEQGFEPWEVKEVYLFNWNIDPEDPSSIFQVDISQVFEAKMQSLLEHKSQISNTTAMRLSMLNIGRKLAQRSSPGTYGLVEWFKRVLFM